MADILFSKRLMAMLCVAVTLWNAAALPHRLLDTIEHATSANMRHEHSVWSAVTIESDHHDRVTVTKSVTVTDARTVVRDAIAPQQAPVEDAVPHHHHSDFGSALAVVDAPVVAVGLYAHSPHGWQTQDFRPNDATHGLKRPPRTSSTTV